MAFKNFQLKLKTAFRRVRDAGRLSPKRAKRLLQHIQQPNRFAAAWWTDASWLSLDLLGICDLYDTCNDFIKWPTRPLNKQELRLAYSVYGKTIDYQNVRVDETAILGPPQYRFCYVSFNTINSWRGMRPDTFIHELMHVWQYQHLGAAYISRALRAQRTTEGYNYGGVEVLRQSMQADKKLLDFNYEQQADIIADYFRIRAGHRPRWGNGGKQDLEVYEYFVAQLSEP